MVDLILEIFVFEGEWNIVMVRLVEFGLVGCCLVLFSLMICWPIKNWFLENFLTFVCMLADDWFVVLTGFEAERGSLDAFI